MIDAFLLGLVCYVVVTALLWFIGRGYLLLVLIGIWIMPHGVVALVQYLNRVRRAASELDKPDDAEIDTT